MPAIDFPNSPTTNQLFNSGGKSWIYDGSAWTLVTSSMILAEVVIEPSTTTLDGGRPNTIQFYVMGPVDAGTIAEA
jgi:hypothetical protein